MDRSAGMRQWMVITYAIVGKKSTKQQAELQPA